MANNFDSVPTEEAMKSFCQMHNVKDLLHKPTRYKNPTSPSCVNLILTNKPRSFQDFRTFETGISYFDKTTFTLLKSSFAKQKPRVLNHRNYKFFKQQSL